MRIREITLALLAIVSGNLPADAANEFGIEGWHEAVLSVRDIDTWLAQWRSVAGYELFYRGDIEKARLAAWQLSDPIGAHEALLRNPGTDTGYLRLVEFRGVRGRPMRSNGQTWETGGWFDVNARVKNLDATFRDLQALGWQGFADPVRMTFGPFVVEEWLARGPDGVVVALIERIEPSLRDWPRLERVSRLFNATQIVTDIDASLDFYVDALGFEVYLESEGPSDSPGPNVLGLPHNLADRISRRVTIVHPEGGNDGSVELLEFDGLAGRDFSAHTRPPNLGVMLLRFPVADAQRLADALAESSATIVAAPRRLNIAPYGEQLVLVVRGLNGEWLEFFEQ